MRIVNLHFNLRHDDINDQRLNLTEEMRQLPALVQKMIDFEIVTCQLAEFVEKGAGGKGGRF